MKSTVETCEDGKKKLVVTVDADEVDARIKKTYKDFAHRYNFPGFRKGKAPRPVIDNMLGPQAVVATVTDDAINETYPLAMDEQNLVAIGQPDFDPSTDMVEAGKPFEYSVTVECRPELELSSYDPVSIKLPSTKATDDEIEEQIEELRNYYYDFEDSPQGTLIEEGSFAEISLAATNAAGEPIDALTADTRVYEVGSALYPAAFDAALVGMASGDTKTIQVDMTQPSIMGQGLDEEGDITFEVTVKGVKTKVLPEITDEWCKATAGFENVAELRERVAETVEQQKVQMSERLRENEALYALQDRLQGSAPVSMCESEEQTLLTNFFTQLQQSGLTFDAYLSEMGLTSDTFQKDLKRQARDVAEQDLALDAWARHAGIQVTEDDIEAEFANAGAEDPQELARQWRENGRITVLRQGIARTRALEQVLESIEVEELAPGEVLPPRVADDESDDTAPEPADAADQSKEAANAVSDEKADPSAAAQPEEGDASDADGKGAGE